MYAIRSYYACSQAVFSAYAEDIGIDHQTACRMMEGLGGGIGGLQEVCGALSAASTVISYYYADDSSIGGEKRKKVYKKVRKAAEIFRKEYDGITCRDALNGEKPKGQCSMKVKDCILIINKILGELDKENCNS